MGYENTMKTSVFDEAKQIITELMVKGAISKDRLNIKSSGRANDVLQLLRGQGFIITETTASLLTEEGIPASIITAYRYDGREEYSYYESQFFPAASMCASEKEFSEYMEEVSCVLGLDAEYYEGMSQIAQILAAKKQISNIELNNIPIYLSNMEPMEKFIEEYLLDGRVNVVRRVEDYVSDDGEVHPNTLIYKIQTPGDL